MKRFHSRTIHTCTRVKERGRKVSSPPLKKFLENLSPSFRGLSPFLSPPFWILGIFSSPLPVWVLASKSTRISSKFTKKGGGNFPPPHSTTYLCMYGTIYRKIFEKWIELHKSNFCMILEIVVIYAFQAKIIVLDQMQWISLQFIYGFMTGSKIVKMDKMKRVPISLVQDLLNKNQFKSSTWTQLLLNMIWIWCNVFYQKFWWL